MPNLNSASSYYGDVGSLIGQCGDCCPSCPSPDILSSSAYAVGRKYGYPITVGTVSHYYKEKDITEQYSGVLLGGNGGVAGSCTSNYHSQQIWTSASHIQKTINSNYNIHVSTGPGSCSYSYYYTNTTTPPTVTGGVVGGDAGGACFGSCSSTGTNSTTYSNEYTTSQLQGTVSGALPALPPLSFSGGADIASSSLSINQAHYAISKGQYQFRFPFPYPLGPTGTQLFTIKWNETFTPDDATIAPTSNAKTYSYGDTTQPPGYKESDRTTWPTSPIYTVDPPGSNGTISLDSVVATCKSTESD